MKCPHCQIDEQSQARTGFLCTQCGGTGEVPDIAPVASRRWPPIIGAPLTMARDILGHWTISRDGRIGDVLEESPLACLLDAMMAAIDRNP